MLRMVRATPELNLSTLASDTAIVVVVTPAATDTYRVRSAKMVWNLNGLTAGEGPLTVGYAHSDYTVPEIKECLEATTSINLGDKIAQERANRLIRIVGSVDSEDSRLNDGRPVITKLNWKIAIGSTLNIFAFNESTATLTTGSSLKISGNLWILDPRL